MSCTTILLQNSFYTYPNHLIPKCYMVTPSCYISVLVQSSYCNIADCKLEGSWRIVLIPKSVLKQLQRRHRQQCLKIDTKDCFVESHFSVNRKQCAGIIFAGMFMCPYLCTQLRTYRNKCSFSIKYGTEQFSTIFE